MRFFDVGQSQQQNSNYFSSLDNWYNTGGASHLLHYLKNFDLSTCNVRVVPQTEALQDQKLETLDSVNQWLYNCLQAGEFRHQSVGGSVIYFDGEASKVELYDIYCSSLRNDRFVQPVKENKFWKQMASYSCVNKGKYKRSGDHRFQMMNISSLEAARSDFDTVNALGVKWVDVSQVDSDDIFDN